jgi:plastocyanin
VKIDAMSTLPAVSVTSAVTVANQITINVTANAGGCVYPTSTAMRVKAGSKVRFINKFAANNITIHSNGGAQGIPHEPDPGHAPNTPYEKTFSGSGTFDWYCHAPGPNMNANNPKFEVVP